MFERVRAFIRGESSGCWISKTAPGPSQEKKGLTFVQHGPGGLERARNKGGPREARRNMGVYTPYPRKDIFTPLTKTPKEILAMESVSFPEPPPLIGTPKKKILNKFYDYHGDRGHNTNDSYQLKKQIEEVVASGKLAHLVKDICPKTIQRNGNRKVTVVSIESLRECKHLERVQGSRKEVQWRQRKEKMSRIRKQVILRSKSNPGRGPTSDPMSLGKTRCAGKHRVHKRRPVAPKGRLALKEKVSRWLGEGLIRKVLHPEWITNAIPIKLTNGTWKVQMDYFGLNKACTKDMYPIPDEGEELASLMGYPYKCFLQLPKEYSQIRMAEEDEEKTGFHMEEGVYCFTHMPKELKNSATTLQRMMEKVLTDQRGRNVEIYLEKIVIKNKSESDLVQDVKETLRKLKRVNIKIDPAMSSFGVKEGRFLGYIVTKEGLKADPRRIQAIILSPTPRSPNQIRSLFVQLTAISKFIPKLAELKHTLREVRTRMETEKGPGWTNEAEEAF
ncbi:hypothetical protein Tco_1129980 [Tanacetum coccineum]